MPANTPRGYPYSLPADPANVPGAIQALAEAIDGDVQDRDDSIAPRPAFRLSSTVRIAFPTTTSVAQVRVFSFDVQDAIVGGAIAPLQGPVSRVTPLLPGFWWFVGSMTFPRAGGTFMDFIGVTLQTGTQVLARNSTHTAPPPSDAGNNISVSAGSFFNGTTDFVELAATTHTSTPGGATAPMYVRQRYLFGMRMTES